MLGIEFVSHNRSRWYRHGIDYVFRSQYCELNMKYFMGWIFAIGALIWKPKLFVNLRTVALPMTKIDSAKYPTCGTREIFF